ncbi:MAG: hypothetical protein IPH07_08710 [Deltaproteobacteria bacterium]|nr:hypothetical protein [Deltaproteobacteria bacterium]MBP7290525.1 hypothetical protein [Nannocystaceae bacterium]
MSSTDRDPIAVPSAAAAAAGGGGGGGRSGGPATPTAIDRPRDQLALGSAYLAQGLVYGWGGYLLLPRLAEAESLGAQAAIMSLAGVPWVFKLLWGPWVDGPRARRRGPLWLVAIASFAIAGALAVLAWRGEPSAVSGPVAVAWLAVNLAMSLQDVAADAFALDRLSPRARGRGFAIMLGAHHVGGDLLVATWLAPWAALPGGMPAVTAWIAAGVAAIAAVLLGSARAPVGRPMLAAPPSWAQGLRSFAGRRRLLLLASLVFAADVVTSAVSYAWLVGHLGWTPAQMAERLGWLLAPATLLGFASAALVLSRLGNARAAIVSSAVLGLAWVGFAAAAAAWHRPVFVQTFAALQAIVIAWLYTATHAVLADATWPRLRATQFAVLTAATNLPRLWAPGIGALLVGGFGFAGTFAACGLWQLAIAAMLPWATRITAADPGEPTAGAPPSAPA